MTLPHNHDAERAVLCAVLFDNTLMEQARGVLTAEDFHRDAHVRVWRTLERLAGKGSALDMVTVHAALDAAGDLEHVGAEYLATLISAGVRSLNLAHYAEIVRQKALLRRAAIRAKRIEDAALAPEAEASEVLDDALASLMELSAQATPGDLVAGSTLATEAMAWLEDVSKRRADRRVSGVPSGLVDLDQMTDGFQPGDLVILAARPSQGKSAMALQLALAAEGPVAFFSLEMSRGQLAARALATLARVDGWAMRKGFLTREEQSRVSRALDTLAESGLSIDESPALTVAQIRAKARRWQLGHGLAEVIVDYLQLITPSSSKGRRDTNREQEVAAMTRGLKALARDLKVPVIALAQLNRQTEQSRDREPTLANLRESGAVEQDADLVLFIHRPDGQSVAKEGDVNLIVAKNRTGPVGSVNLRWFPPSTRFESAHSMEAVS